MDYRGRGVLVLNSLVSLYQGGAGGGGGSFESIATVTGTGAETTLTIGSIPSTYKSLQIRYMARSTKATTDVSLFTTYNGDTTTSNYYSHGLYADGGVNAYASNGYYTELYVPAASIASGIYAVGIIDILDYASTSKNKTIRIFSGVNRNSSSVCDVELNSNLWMSTNAINSITFSFSTTGNFAAGSTFALYGIKG